MQQQDGLLSCLLCELISLQTSMESNAIDRVTVLKLSIVQVVAAKESNTTLLSRSKVSANQRLSRH